RVNPFALSVEARDFVLNETDGTRLIAFERLYVNLQLRSLLRRALVLSEISLERPFVDIVRFEDGRINLESLGGSEAPTQEGAQAAQLPPLVVDEIRIVEGTVQVTDAMPRTDFQTTLGPVNVALSNLSTLPDETGRQQVEIATPGGVRLAWTGSLSLQPFASSGRVTGAGPWLSLLYRYLQDDLDFELGKGEIELAFDYRLAWRADGELDAEIAGLDVDLSGIVARSDEAPEEFLELPSQSLRGGYLRLAERSAGAESLRIEQPLLRVARYADGRLNLEGLLQAEAAGPAEELSDTADSGREADGASDPADPNEDEADGWSWRIGRLEIDQMRVEFEDRALRGDPARVVVAPLRLEVSEISNEPGAKLPVKASATLESGGRVTIDGEVAWLPSTALRLAVVADDLALAASGPYLGEVARVSLDEGTLDVTADLVVDQAEPFAVTGDAAIEKLAVRDAVLDQLLLAWQRVAVDRFEYSTAKNRLAISELDLAGPYVRLLIDADGTTNFQQLAVEPASAPAEAAPATPTPAPLQVTIGRVRVGGASVDFTDRDVPLPFSAAIREFGGQVSTLATGSRKPAEVKMEGKVGRYGLARLEGSLNPFDPVAATDMRLIFRNVEFPDLSPYTVKFAGRRIEDGRLDVDLRYLIEEGRLQGENRVVIDRLKLGEKVAYPDATDLPLGLAVALLKKPDGTIDIELPVRGDLNDPQFSIGGVVFRAFVNLVTRLATAPFRLLGSLVGAESANLDQVAFAPGRADLAPPEQEKLLRLTEALAQRPQLTITVAGASNAEADGAALREASLEAAVEALLAGEKGRRADDPLPARQRRALEALLRQREPALDLDALQETHRRPVNPADPDGASELDEPAYLDAMRTRLLEAETVAADDIAALAAARAGNVREALLATGSITAERVRSAEARAGGIDADGAVLLKLEAGVE
ncbi:MAG: DUF748 domain-containing protein, partial [Gammaproteobacteria bacterium]|nr:DUF748 domain-containing protein [Gammaproteobacteria bacterium]